MSIVLRTGSGKTNPTISGASAGLCLSPLICLRLLHPASAVACRGTRASPTHIGRKDGYHYDMQPGTRDTRATAVDR